MKFLEGFLSQWEIVLDNMPQNLEALGEVVGFVSIVVITLFGIVLSLGGLAALSSRIRS